MSREIDEVKYEVATATRILSAIGLATGVTAALGHVSMRVPNQPELFVVKGRGYAIDALEEMQYYDHALGHCARPGNHRHEDPSLPVLAHARADPEREVEKGRYTDMASATASSREKYGDFNVEVSDHNLGLNLPQRVGSRLWLPMLLMGLMAFPIAIILGAIRADAVSDGDANTAVVLAHVTPGVMFIGFLSIFSAIVFAIARILGAFREGAGGVQEASGRRVLTLVMPMSAKLMLALMMMGMMMLLFGIVAEFVLAVNADGAGASDLQTIDSWGTWVEGVRRLGVAVYLLSFSLGLYTIVNVIRLQSRRIRDLGDEPKLGA